MNGEATGAPDKRVVGGAVPPTSTTSTGCIHCDVGRKLVKMKRQYIHMTASWCIVVCSNKDNQIVSQDRKPGSSDPER